MRAALRRAGLGRRARGGPHGDSPLRLLLTLASFALVVYACLRLFDREPAHVAGWLIGAAAIHDFVLLPLYSAADRLAQKALLRGGHGDPGPRPWINHLRVPVFVSALLLLVWFPLVFEQVDRYHRATALDPGVFWSRWLLITAGLFGASAVALLVRWRLGARQAARAPAGPPPSGRR